MNNLFLFSQMVRRNIQCRFRGNILGWLWSFLLPLLMLTVYTVVFGGLFKSRWGVNENEPRMVFATALFSGITLYNIFGESVSLATTIIISNTNFVKKVRFNLEILPLAQTLSTFILSLFWVLLLLISIGLVFQNVCWSWLLLPLTLAPLVLFSAGVAFFTSSLGVYFRDLQYLIGILLQMLFFLSPVFYRLGNLPLHYQRLLRFNPLVWFIETNRKVLFVIWGIAARIRSRRWRRFDLLLLGSLLLFDLFAAFQVWMFYGVLETQARYLRIALPLCLPFAAEGALAAWNLLKRERRMRLLTLTALAVLLAFNVYSSYSPVVQQYRRPIKRIRQLLSQQAVAIIKEDWRPQPKPAGLDQMKCDQYQSGRRPLVLSCKLTKAVGYLRRSGIQGTLQTLGIFTRLHHHSEQARDASRL